MNFDDNDSAFQEGGTYSTGRQNEEPRHVGRTIAMSLMLVLGCIVAGLLSAGVLDHLSTAVRDTAADQHTDVPADESALGKAVAPSVVKVSADEQSCFGIIMENDCSVVSDDGYIVTSSGVVSSDSEITVETSNGRTYQASLKGENDSLGLALLKINTTDSLEGATFFAPKMPVGESDGTGYYLDCSAVQSKAAPLTYSPLEQTVRGKPFMTLTTDADPGSAGSPLLNSNGAVVGIFVEQTDDLQFNSSDRQGLALSIIDVCKWVRKVLLNPMVELGIHGNMVSSAEYAPLRFPCAGFYVESVDAGSPAQQAGIEDGDFIIMAEVFDEPIGESSDAEVMISTDIEPGSETGSEYCLDSTDDLFALFDAYRASDTIRLTIRRSRDDAEFYAELEK